MEPREAATVMLVRDAPGASTGASGLPPGPSRGTRAGAGPASTIEVFLLRRNLRSVFVAGAFVFPGGAVDPGDRDPATLGLVGGVDPRAADAMLGTPDALGFWVAAIRESFEEGGVLLARAAVTGAPVDPEVSARLAPQRSAVASGEVSFADLVAEEALVLDAGALRPFARWITPSPAPRRYDTWFFVAPAPTGHAYGHDADETIASEWFRPADALARASRGELELIYPTFRSLQALARFPTTAALFAAVDDAWSGPGAALRVMNPGQGWQLHLPGDDSDSDADALAHSTTSHRRAVGSA